ncbi:MAG: ATP-binding protein [Prosthecobacter sp.]|uniref:ATP-binding protein n=1 Tax=Prosthecobacter sp. TaxID=1965333 RepID=UPI0039041724
MTASQKAVLQEKLALGMSQELPVLTPRQVVMTLLPGKAQAVIGMRRAGKTCFLYQQMQERLAQGARREQLIYLNFEDERLPSLEAEALTFVLDEYYRTHPATRSKQKVLWCLDEVQLVKGWESFVRRILDTEKVEVFVSGSSARMLSQEVATSMRGRALEVVIHPFSFREVLTHQGLPVPDDVAVLTPAKRSRMEKALTDYLVGGGFPETIGLPPDARARLLQSYVDVALLRDVVERHQVANVSALRFLVRHLLANAGSPFSVQKIHNFLTTQGMPVAKNTLHDLLAHLEEAFLVRTVWMESASERQRMVNPRKAYPIDPALMALYDRSGRANTGHMLETLVLLELERRRAAVTWVRTPAGYEIDFLARHADGRQELIQVCADASDPATAEREFRALADATTSFPRAKRTLLTLHQTGFPKTSPPAKIEVQTAWQWLLT